MRIPIIRATCPASGNTGRCSSLDLESHVWRITTATHGASASRIQEGSRIRIDGVESRLNKLTVASEDGAKRIGGRRKRDDEEKGERRGHRREERKRWRLQGIRRYRESEREKIEKGLKRREIERGGKGRGRVGGREKEREREREKASQGKLHMAPRDWLAPVSSDRPPSTLIARATCLRT